MIRLLRLQLLLLPVLVLVNCAYPFFLNSGSIRMATKKESVKSTYLLGYIENRDSHFDPFHTKNLSSMLKFELLNAGYGILVLDDYIKPGEDMSPGKEAASKRGETKDLLAQLAENAKMSGGGSASPGAEGSGFLSSDYGSKLLRESEIKTVQGVTHFDFFIQGAIAMNDNRKIIDKTENGIIFLEIFDKSGKFVSSINYTVEGRTLTEAELLKSICGRVIDKLEKREDPKPWWRF
ncbi:lipoprotein [Leptospira langatensis]|nr:lipoprotein [Leptospira langatensis]